MATTATLTLDEFLKLPETKPYSEFVDGEIRQTTMGTLAHGICQARFSFVFGVWIRDHDRVGGGPNLTCIFGPEGRERALVPDFVVIAAERLRGIRWDDYFRGAPDLVIEILSPDDRWIEVIDKVEFYLANGVRLVWLVNTQNRTVMLFDSPTTPRVLTDDDTLDGGDVIPGFSTSVREILPPPDLLR